MGRRRACAEFDRHERASGHRQERVAWRLARLLRCPLIDKDDVKDYTLSLPDGNALAYAIMWQVAGTQLALGLDVVVDSPLSYPVGYEQAQELAAAHGARLWVVETWLDEAEWRRRLDSRPPEASCSTASP